MDLNQAREVILKSGGTISEDQKTIKVSGKIFVDKESKELIKSDSEVFRCENPILEAARSIMYQYQRILDRPEEDDATPPPQINLLDLCQAFNTYLPYLFYRKCASFKTEKDDDEFQKLIFESLELEDSLMFEASDNSKIILLISVNNNKPFIINLEPETEKLQVSKIMWHNRNEQIRISRILVKNANSDNVQISGEVSIARRAIQYIYTNSKTIINQEAIPEVHKARIEHIRKIIQSRKDASSMLLDHSFRTVDTKKNNILISFNESGDQVHQWELCYFWQGIPSQVMLGELKKEKFPSEIDLYLISNLTKEIPSRKINIMVLVEEPVYNTISVRVWSELIEHCQRLLGPEEKFEIRSGRKIITSLNDIENGKIVLIPKADS